MYHQEEHGHQKVVRGKDSIKKPRKDQLRCPEDSSTTEAKEGKRVSRIIEWREVRSH